MEYQCKECGHITDRPDGVSPKACCECGNKYFEVVPHSDIIEIIDYHVKQAQNVKTVNCEEC
jgi:predicted  nucleic acid-binding Zn-ribbon protein